MLLIDQIALASTTLKANYFPRSFSSSVALDCYKEVESKYFLPIEFEESSCNYYSEHTHAFIQLHNCPLCSC